MKYIAFGSRTTKEIVRDPLSMFFGLGFPVILLLLLTAINQNIPNDLFNIEQLTPGIAVFGLSFMALFSAQLVSKDQSSSFLSRLFTTPMTASDFILGYSLPLIVMAFIQGVICYMFALLLGMNFSVSMLVALLNLIPASIIFVGLGLFFGTIFSEKAATAICGAILTNITAWLSGIWFDLNLVGGMFSKIAYLLPFVHAVDMGKAAAVGEYHNMLPHVWWVLGYCVVIVATAVIVFHRKMKGSS